MSPKTSAPKGGRVATRSVGTYWDAGVLELARAAYLSDLDHDLEPDVAPRAFVAWLESALRRHSRLTPGQRAALAVPQPPRRRGSRGVMRTFSLPVDLLDAVDEQLVADRRAGRALGRSGFVHESVLMAIDGAVQRRGEPLESPPSRLPTRPIRPSRRVRRPGGG